ncbi:long-chain fatty acid--CoA ligase [Frankia sp. AgPm24]|uniref:AMP-dependent synthetase/ligase n=1 Tax=Frankia sp. AgPm24 TaxID=631128 RepID=UPI00200D016B|nr:long-chain fatty acid--CoA ligase [Frankia sp. AgPm24]MCK9922344.1 long-chain fatty acid--CoA ligase [Frankia sp. AgPm24]
MREYTSAPAVSIADDATLTDAVLRNAGRDPDHVLLRRKDGDRFIPITQARFRDAMHATARGLVARGVTPGDRVGILSRSRYEWTVLDYAIWAAGAVTVPIYETSSPDQIEWILADAGVEVLVVEDAELAGRVASIRADVPALREVLVIEAEPSATSTDDSAGSSSAAGALAILAEAGAAVDEGQLTAARATQNADSLATIIYTSGTTARPKGCEITHRALLFIADDTVAMLPSMFTQHSSTLLFLPLAHVFARMLQVGVVQGAFELSYSPDTRDLLADLAHTRPTFLLAVPRVFEKVHAGARTKAHGEGRGRIFDAAEQTAVDYSESLDHGGPGLGLKLRHRVFDKLVYGKLRAALGGRARIAVSGGAPLSPRLGHFYRGIGFIVLEGYGLTETTAPATANRPGAIRMGTVGQPLPGVTVRIADDGEVLIRGPLLFRGYRNNETATKEALDSEGFLHTGDLGELDDDGFLRIIGRKKELLVTAGGKNVAPAPLEHIITSSPLISQAMLVGDGRPYIAALVTLEPDAFERWRDQAGRPATASLADLADDPQLCAEVQKAVDTANATVSRAESVRRFVILPEDFTVEGGELTPSLKVRRSLVLKRYADAVESLYPTGERR